jgi:hypothetical protein
MSDVLLAQSSGEGCGALGVLVYLAIIVVVIAGVWKTFAKAGQPGWAAIIPVYNVYVMCRIAGKPGWWVILMIVPLVNIIIIAIVSIDIARAFGKGTGFGIGLWLLSFIFFPILGFGSAQYQGPSR